MMLKKCKKTAEVKLKKEKDRLTTADKLVNFYCKNNEIDTNLHTIPLMLQILGFKIVAI